MVILKHLFLSCWKLLKQGQCKPSPSTAINGQQWIARNYRPCDERKHHHSFFIPSRRWKKCKSKISVLTNSGGQNRPGQSGTTGQLFFSKCGDPPEGCECKYEPPSGND